jgi:hypothetical protein
MLERLDRMFACLSWVDLFPHHNLRALASTASDHAPLLLATNISSPIFRRFKFESIWPKLPGFLEAVEAGWNCDAPNVDTFHCLDMKFRSTVKSLRSWSQKQVGSVRLQLAVASEVISMLDRTQERQLLSPAELELRRELKFKSLGLASLARTIMRQRSRITYLREGDANTRFFHLQACHRGRKSFIDRIVHQGTVYTLRKATKLKLSSITLMQFWARRLVARSG